MAQSPNPDPPKTENQKGLITKARNNENTKKRPPKFRAFQLSCFRDEKKFYHKMQKNNN